ncbi:MAG: SDR family NAD(P)-dependent oxidoreductase, partial [Acidimicrobiia bacterium]|nr:SDR family NAD(P)-dependent oxidoreductase [Acidimicrobiia bacterium]
WGPAYSASKAAVDTYMEGIAAWLVDTGLDTTVIRPGYIDTGIFDDGDELPNVFGIDETIGPLTDAIVERRPEAVIPAEPYEASVAFLRGVPVDELKKLTPPSRA